MSNLNEAPDQSQDSKREWSPPRVQRMSAGSAEDGGNVTPDGGQPS